MDIYLFDHMKAERTTEEQTHWRGILRDMIWGLLGEILLLILSVPELLDLLTCPYSALYTFTLVSYYPQFLKWFSPTHRKETCCAWYMLRVKPMGATTGGQMSLLVLYMSKWFCILYTVKTHMMCRTLPLLPRHNYITHVHTWIKLLWEMEVILSTEIIHLVMNPAITSISPITNALCGYVYTCECEIPTDYYIIQMLMCGIPICVYVMKH